MKKILLFAATLAACLGLCACSRLEFSADALMQAPVLTPQQTEIKEALLAAVGFKESEIQFRYPKTGKYRSAFVMHDMNDDGVEEAMVFYDLKELDTSVRVHILTKSQDGWVSDSELSGGGSSIESVDFSHISSREVEDVVITWGEAGRDDKIAAAYSYREGGLMDISSTPLKCHEMMIYDINKDGLGELLLLRNSGEVTMKLAAMNSAGELAIASTVELSAGTTGFARVQIGKLDRSNEAIFVDLKQGYGYSTDIIKYDFAANRLVNVKMLLEKKEIPDFQRATEVFCEDVNGDGRMDVPVTENMLGYESGGEGETLYLTQYLSYDGTGFSPVWQGVVNVEESYRFEYPEEWLGVVTVKREMETGELQFYVYNKTLDDVYQQLLRLRTYNKTQTKDKFEETYETLPGGRGTFEYLMYIPKDKIEDELLVLTYPEVTQRFTIMNQ